MEILAIDLGTTNIKVAAFDAQLQLKWLESAAVTYETSGVQVEFDCEGYFEVVLETLMRGLTNAKRPSTDVRQIVLTGQAESLVVLDRAMKPLRKGISWMDERSKKECDELSAVFSQAEYYPVTGQLAILPTWPATKILHLKRYEPSVFESARYYLLLKDYIQFRLTGVVCGEYSIYNFSFYFDVQGKCYWKKMLDYCGIRQDQLPPLVEPGTNIGPLLPEVGRQLGLSQQTTVNVGTLDHFAGMLGTGNLAPGVFSESTGTVLSLAAFHSGPFPSSRVSPCHYGPFPDSRVLLSVCESGGISLEWFKTTFLPKLDFGEMTHEIQRLELPNELIFLPYLTGTNAPEYDTKASGTFTGLKLNHTRFDLAYAVMEGVAHLLLKNLRTLSPSPELTGTILSTGGGAKSDFWCQLKADVCGVSVMVPQTTEAACLGAAMMGAVEAGFLPSFEAAVQNAVSFRKVFQPRTSPALQAKHQRFNELYERLFSRP